MQLPPAKTAFEQQQQSLVAASLATLSFVTFQLLDLQDSLSAQASSILDPAADEFHWNSTGGHQKSFWSLAGIRLMP